jgi:hypothetical protein
MQTKNNCFVLSGLELMHVPCLAAYPDHNDGLLNNVCHFELVELQQSFNTG